MNKNIKVSYSLYAVENDGKEHLVERTSPNQPFQFISGLGMVLEAFEQEVVNLEADDKFEFSITADQAYGPYMEEHVIKLSRDAFSVDGHFDADHIFPGAEIPLVNEDGTRFDGIVKAVDADNVTVDLNHPLAGQDLIFKGHVIDSRPATPEELQGALNLMSGEGCECGCEGGSECGCQSEGHHHCNHHHEKNDGHCGCGHGHCHNH